MKHVHPSVTARIDRESSFHHCGGPVKLVQACLTASKHLETSFTNLEALSSLCKPVYVHEWSHKAVLTSR